MGRVDISRHRRASPSDTKPIPVPRCAEWTVEYVSQHPDPQLQNCVNSMTGSPTQRAQVAAVKMLGVVLRDSHIVMNDGRGHVQCPCRSGASSDTVHQHEKTCTMAGSWLAGVLFDSPDATPGLVATALRAYLRSRDIIQITEIEERFDAFFSEIERYGLHADFIEAGQLPHFACTLCAAVALLSEDVSRSWLLEDARISGLLRIVCSMASIYAKASVDDKTLVLPGESDAELVVHRPEHDRKLLEDATDSAMKIAQDVLNYVVHSSSVGLKLDKSIISDVLHACHTILMLESAPRSCAMACAVALVTSVLLLKRCENLLSSRTIMEALRQDVLTQVSHYREFSQLSILRGVMEAPAARSALEELLFPIENESGDTIFELLARLCSLNSDVHMRFLAMEAMIACLKRRGKNKKLNPYCRRVVLGLIYERWQEPFPGVTSQIRDAMHVLVSVCGNDAESKTFWEKMAFSMLEGDWFLKGMYAPLSVLVSKVGAMRILEAKPNCQFLAMKAAATDSRLSKPVSDWLGSFWNVLLGECGSDADMFTELTAKPLTMALVDKFSKELRERCAEYMLPTYLKCKGMKSVSATVDALLQLVKEVTMHDRPQQVRGTVTVLSVARRNGVFAASFSNPDVVSLLREALRSNEEDVRASALDLVVNCRVITEPVRAEEFELVLSNLHLALMPGCSPTDRSRFRHSMRRFFERLAACRSAAADGSGGWWMRYRKEMFHSKRTPEFESLRTSFLKSIERFEDECLSVLVRSCYPGAPFWRKTISIEVVTLFIKNLGLYRDSRERENSLSLIVSVLVSCLLDAWEHPRRATMEALSSFPGPVPGINSHRNVIDLQNFAMPLLNSPRQKDVDGGALILRLIFRKYVLMQASIEKNGDTTNDLEMVNLQLHFSADKERRSTLLDLTTFGSVLVYVDSVLDSVEILCDRAEENYSKMCETGLFHGRFLLLRYLLQDMPWTSLLSTEYYDKSARFVQRFVELSWRCTRIAMNGVSIQAAVDVSDRETDLLEGDNIFLQEGKKLERTACFLSMKEICIALGILCHNVPLPESSPGREKAGLLNEDSIRKIGEMYLHVFTNSRHWGVLDGASEGFQLLCERLLKNSGISLRSLPKAWVLETLADALRGELYVLRRSAGIPSLMNAVANAESVSNNRSHEAPLLNGMMTSLLSHLGKSHLFVDASRVGTKRSKDEESVSHALNLLRSLFLNSNISSGVLRHFELATIYCINAFCSASWLIRNSAMMLFSALIRRGIGACVEKKQDAWTSSFSPVSGTSATISGERRMRGVTALQFFSRHPKLHPFLLKILESSVAKMKESGMNDHAALYPSLYLVSCLSPTAKEDPSLSISMGGFRVALRSCAHMRVEHVRYVAAAASVSVFEDSSKVPGEIEKLLRTGVPEEPISVRLRSAFARSSERADAGAYVDEVPLLQNRVHGELLIICAVLRGTWRIMSPQDKVKAINILSEMLPKRIWLAVDDHKNACSHTRAAMIALLHVTLDLAMELKESEDKGVKESATNIVNLAISVARSVQGVKARGCTPGSYVAIDYLREVASKFLIRVATLQRLSFKERLDLLTVLVGSSFREERVHGLELCVDLLSSVPADVQSKDITETVKWIWNIATTAFSGNDEVLQVMGMTLMKSILAAHRINHEVVQELLTCTPTNTVEALHDAAQFHGCLDVQEQALVLLGSLCSILSGTRLLLTWINQLEASVESQQTSTRMAVLSSVRASRILEDERPMSSLELRDVVARGWLIVCTLLEDERTNIREAAIATANASRGDDELWEGILPSLIRIFRLLGIKFGDCSSVQKYITKSLWGTNETLDSVLSGNPKRENVPAPSQHVDGVTDSEGKLFELEAESDGEPILQQQLATVCCLHILLNPAYSTIQGSCDMSSAVLALQELEVVLNGCFQADLGFIGGITYTKEDFERCHAAILRAMLILFAVNKRGTSWVDIWKGVEENVDSLMKFRRFHHSLDSAISSFPSCIQSGSLDGLLFLLGKSAV